jgi:hypothetical protein
MNERLLTVDELAQWLKLTPKGVRSLMQRGKLRRGVHYVRPPGLSTRFKEGAIQDWLDGAHQNDQHAEPGEIKMVKGYKMK